MAEDDTQLVGRIETADQIRRFEEFIELHSLKALMKAAASGARSLVLDFGELSKFDPELATLLLEEPEEVIKAAEIAMSGFDVPSESNKIRIRIGGLTEHQKVLIRNIRAEHLEKFLMIEGTVRQKSDVRPQVTAARFECPSCGNVMNVLQLDNKFKEPTRCGCGRKGKFRLLSKELVDAQGIVLEESSKDLEGGAQPKRMNVLLKDELVSPISDKKTNPGTSIRVHGTVKEVPIILRTGGQSTKFDLIIEANYVQALEEDYTNIEINKEDQETILELSRNKTIKEMLVRSLAPGIYGHEKVKEAMLMQFVGGVGKMRTDGVHTRGDIHILLIGDPGSGKSMLLKRAAVVAPKARYVSGKGVTGAGLTATVVRDEFLSGWSLEAGALVLANKGVVMIDELDKMSDDDRAAMHEGLEQQSYHHDFEIMFADGHAEKIGEYVDRMFLARKVIKCKNCEIVESVGDRFLTTDFQNIIETTPTRISRHKAPAHYYRISFSNGRSITVTPEHPIFHYKGGISEIPAKDVRPGMIVPSARNLPIKGKRQLLLGAGAFPSVLTRDLSILLGYIASEGHTYRSVKNRYSEIGISNTDMRIIDECSGLMKGLFKTHVNINRSPKESKKKATRDQFTVRCSSRQLYEYFSANFPELLRKANKKRVPDRVRMAERHVRMGFLASYFAGDGFIDSERTGFSTSSEKMAEDLQDLLLCASINSYVATEKRKEKKYYKVVVSGQSSLQTFLNEVVRNDPRRGCVEGFLKRSGKRRNARDCIPKEWLLEFNSFLKKVHASDGYFTTLISRNQNSHKEVALDYLNKARKKAGPEHREELNRFERFLNNDIRFLEVKKVKKITDRRYRWVYDVTIEPQKTFISQGLILHNTISISKANIQATLRCETTVLAAANPKFGRFDPYETIAKQIDLPPTLINRFDLIFTIKDLPDEEKDSQMAGFILEMHKTSETKNADIDTDMLRKYLVYCRQKSFPKLTDGAVQELKEYYIKMRGSGSSEGSVKSIPISARQLEALVRLAEASAKIRLSDKVTKKDAKDAIALLHYCLEQVGLDPETGKIDIDRITTGITSSERGKIITVRELIAELEEKVGKAVPIADVLSAAAERGLSNEDVDEAIEKLKRSGDIFQPRKDTVSRI